jgi:hypothetical protein
VSQSPRDQNEQFGKSGEKKKKSKQATEKYAAN